MMAALAAAWLVGKGEIQVHAIYGAWLLAGKVDERRRLLGGYL